MAVHPIERFAPGPGSGLEQVLDLVRECREALADVREVVTIAHSDLVTAMLAELGELALAVDAAEVAVVAEAVTRGVPAAGPVPLPAAAWVAAASRRYQAGAEAGRLVKLAEAVSPATVTRSAGVLSLGQDGEALGEAILDAQVPVACGATAIAEMARLVKHLRPECVSAVWEAYAALAAGGDPGEVRRLRPAMHARFGSAEELSRDEEKARTGSALNGGRVDPIDGLTDYRLTLHPEAVAILEAALDPLTEPQPGPNGEADARPWATRRADAVIELIQRAVRAADAVPLRAATQVSLMVKAADLRDSTGCATTIGTLDAGRFLSIAAARELSCGAELAPVLLGDDDAPVAIGRSKRLFTRQQVRALHLRDGGCTFPHCARPAGWSDAHHLVHWADGGPTDLANAALLCGYHHHIVHSRRLAGWVTTARADPTDAPGIARPPDATGATGPPRVVWDLAPGSYDARRRPRVA